MIEDDLELNNSVNIDDPVPVMQADTGADVVHPTVQKAAWNNALPTVPANVHGGPIFKRRVRLIASSYNGTIRSGEVEADA